MLETRIQTGLDAVEAAMQNSINSDVETLQDASLHIIKSGGKRIRPRISLLAFVLAGGDDMADVATAAAAVELVHTATLVHDDINDHSAMRRGQVAVHARWGRTFALLTGDYMFAKVYAMMAPLGTEANKVMADAAVTLVEGETIQAKAAKAGVMDRETYKLVIERKTASLFIASAELGAILAGADEKTRACLREYGRYVGLTYQIVDDILDLVGDPETMGKPAGLDLAQNRGVAMTAVNGNGNSAVLEAEAEEDDPVARMMQQLRDSGAVDVARIEADNMAQKAREALYQLPRSEARDELESIIDLIRDRES